MYIIYTCIRIFVSTFVSMFVVANETCPPILFFLFGLSDLSPVIDSWKHDEASCCGSSLPIPTGVNVLPSLSFRRELLCQSLISWKIAFARRIQKGETWRNHWFKVLFRSTSAIIEQHCQDFTCLGPSVPRDT